MELDTGYNNDKYGKKKQDNEKSYWLYLLSLSWQAGYCCPASGLNRTERLIITAPRLAQVFGYFLHKAFLPGIVIRGEQCLIQVVCCIVGIRLICR